MMTVFIADDEEMIREGLNYIIDWNALGFTICGEAGDGEQALSGILTRKPDLVLLDIRMPKLAGTEIVKMAREQNYNGHFIILSGFSDFKYAQTAIRYGVDFYLTKPLDEDELTAAVKTVRETLWKENTQNTAINRYREKAKCTILHDLILHPGEMNYINLREMNLSFPVYQIVIYESYNQDTFYLPYRFEDLLKVTNQKNNSFEPIKIYEKNVILLKGKFALERFNDFLKHYEKSPQKGSPLDSLFITYGRLVYRAEDIHCSYEDAKDLMNRRFFCEQNQHAIGYEQLPDFEQGSHELSAGDSERYCRSFCDYIQSYNRKMIADTLLSLEKYLYSAQAELPGIRLFLTDIYLQIKQTMNRIYGTVDILFPTNSALIDFIESKYYLYEIILFFSEQFEMIMNAIGNPSSESILDEIVHYVSHNYSEPIKLETIAPLFGYNSSYLGRIFSKKMGESFHSYVDRVRISHSKELLLQKNLKVYEVAEHVGYKNVDYFHKKFKKYAEETPAEFRKKHS